MSESVRNYAYLWGKYRPMILKLMIDSEKETQNYQFTSHEILDINPKKSSGYAFKLRILNGKALNNIKTSHLAQDLQYVLKQSGKALQLMSENTFEFDMDRKFFLQVKRIEEEPKKEEVKTEEVELEEIKTEEPKAEK